MNRWKLTLAAPIALAIAVTAAGACSSSSSTSREGTSVSVGESSTTSSVSVASSSTGAGGAGTGGGGTGGTTTCLDASTFASGFAIADATFCAVAVYTNSESLGYQQPTWGSHHGPLVAMPDASGTGVTLERWTAPAGTTGVLTKTSTDVVANVPTGAYLGEQANDLPFFGWTGITWTDPAPDGGTTTEGALAVLTGTSAAQTYPTNGPYAMAGLAGGNGEGRVLFTALSPIGVPATTTNGLYAADACSNPSEELGAGTGCAASSLISAWGENSGPIALDKNGDAFVVLTSPSTGTQEARGFLAGKVARGQGATPGVTLFTVNGFSGGLAAITPTATTPGLVVFQTFDATTYDALDVIEQTYAVGTDITTSGSPRTLLAVPSGGMNGLSLFTDDSDRLWVAYSDATSSTYVVLARKH